MPQHDIERAPIERQHGVEAGLDRQVEPAVLSHVTVQEARAQHRRQRQRYERGHRDCRHDGHGEFAEQAADDPAHH